MEYNLDQLVNHRIATLAQLLKRQIFRIIAKNKIEITPDQWVVINYLWEEDGLSVGEIASRSRKDFANVTRIIDKLVKQGYVKKEKSEKDSRVSKVYILSKAEKIKGKVQDCWKESMDIALMGIKESEQQTLLKLIERIENNVLESLEQE